MTLPPTRILFPALTLLAWLLPAAACAAERAWYERPQDWWPVVSLRAADGQPHATNDAVGVEMSLRSPALAHWRLEASSRRTPVRPRSVELLDFSPTPRTHRHGARLHQVRSLGLEADLHPSLGLRLDWNRYEMLPGDFHVLGLGFTWRLR